MPHFGELLLELGDCVRDEQFILQMAQVWIVQA